jgi:predicted outer membrane repeat protein
LNWFSDNAVWYADSRECNSSKCSGGAIFLQSADVTQLTILQDWSFHNNTASNFGGAIAIQTLIGVSPSLSAIANFSSDFACYGHNIAIKIKKRPLKVIESLIIQLIKKV